MAVPRASLPGDRRRGGVARTAARSLALPALVAPLVFLARQFVAPAAPARQDVAPPVAFFEVFTGGGQETPSDQNQQRGEQPPQEQGDWKEEAMKRQQERIQWRKDKASPNRKRSAKEILKQRARDKVWKAMSTRSSEGILNEKEVYDRDRGSFIKVTVEKPLGVEFMELQPDDPSGAMIGDITEGGNVDKTDKIDIGDILVKVGSKDVAGLPMNDGIQPILEADGEFELMFFRPDFN